MPLLVARGKGYLLVNPDTWTATDYYADYRGDQEPEFLAGNDSFLLFAIHIRPDQDQFDMRYGFKTTQWTTILNLWDAVTGRLLAKAPPPGRDRPYFVVKTMLGEDAVVADFGKIRTIARWSFLEQARVDITPPAEAHLHMAANLLELGEDAEALKHLDRFEKGFPGDLRGVLLRVKALGRKGDREAAGRLAYKAMVSGGVGDDDLQALLPAVRAIRPIVQGALRATKNGGVAFKHVLPSGLIVAAPDITDGDDLNAALNLLGPGPRAIEVPGDPGAVGAPGQQPEGDGGTGLPGELRLQRHRLPRRKTVPRRATGQREGDGKVRFRQRSTC